MQLTVEPGLGQSMVTVVTMGMGGRPGKLCWQAGCAQCHRTSLCDSKPTECEPVCPR